MSPVAFGKVVELLGQKTQTPTLHVASALQGLVPLAQTTCLQSPQDTGVARHDRCQRIEILQGARQRMCSSKILTAIDRASPSSNIAFSRAATLSWILAASKTRV